ncbi:MAG: PQQ-binding-like beta-propeller repeat protein, partial [Verrucomicrobia bacterium]|nr:PQQ-binding-like beta-propeller repeat protein [Verrucomicrobiota bacterium]
MKGVAFLACLVLSGSIAWADDWPQVNGLTHDRTSTEAIEIDWESEKPKLNWRVACNGGFSSFVVGEGKAFTVLMAKIKSDVREVVVALNKETGKAIWNTVLGKAGYDRGGGNGARNNNGGDGPRATPVIDKDWLYIYGGRFDLYALNSETGKIIWSRDILKEFGGSMIRWSNAMSPL